MKYTTSELENPIQLGTPLLYYQGDVARLLWNWGLSYIILLSHFYIEDVKLVGEKNDGTKDYPSKIFEHLKSLDHLRIKWLSLGSDPQENTKCRSVFPSQKCSSFRGIRWHAALGNFSSFAFLKKPFSTFYQEITAQEFALVSARIAFCQAKRMHLLSDERSEWS